MQRKMGDFFSPLLQNQKRPTVSHLTTKYNKEIT